MFVLAEMKDTVRIKPWHFGVDLREAITTKLNKKLANKVSQRQHFLLSDWKTLLLFTSVHFRFVVFRPFIDEILTGRIRSCNHEGLQVSMEFFDDIVIPYEYLQQPSKFDEDEQLWVWEYATEEGTHDMFMDVNEEIRFRVVDEIFTDLSPAGPEMLSEKKPADEVENKRSPFTITGSITEPGLGLKSWWSG
ncbi:DNA-directed RNA polymerase III subunit RPC8-like isoform X2 [Acropora palmata]|uniref:DNA-directed RNA polymerase III subunit RPC8-like isoform X2 n=1 Tax=Acropora palmata TaxID=6131 RepID=UPI003DA0EFF9